MRCEIMNIKCVIDAIKKGRARISDHADEEADADDLTFDEIYYSIMNGEIIENYLDDKPYSSCLIFGKTFNLNPVRWYNQREKGYGDIQ